MKTLKDLTEEEIFNLTDEEIELMIKLRKAEEGVQFVRAPKVPDYFPVADPDMLTYSCTVFGDNLVFADIEEFNTLLTLLQTMKSKLRLDYDYNKADSSKKYASADLKKPYSGEWHTTTSQRVYSLELYNTVIDSIAQNKKMKEKYEEELKKYESSMHESKWIEDEINEAVMTVKEKFWKLESLSGKFKNDYLPLSGYNTEIALAFMDKAYSLTEDQKVYILENYNKANAVVN